MYLKNWRLMLLLVAGIVSFKGFYSQNISTYLFGQNAWMPDTIGKSNACVDPPCVLYGKLHQKWQAVKDSKASLVRFGGIAGDKNMPTNFQYIKMIDSIRAKGMEPVLQVPFYKYRYTAQQAAAIVQYVNITKGKNVKYWIIGNEPDLSYGYTTAAQVATYFKSFASAMKAVDPEILIIGPECAWYNHPIMDGLTTPNGPDDITGKDAAGRYYVDIISFHYYPFNGSQSRAQVISNLTSPGALQDKLIHLNNRLNNCNSFHNRTGLNALKSAVTEANVNWQNNASDNLNGVGVNSFVGGQFIAEMFAIGMKHNVNMINVWSVIEGNNNSLNIGYLDAVNGNKKPAFYHFMLAAENFNGTYINASCNQSNVKVMACKNASNIVLMVLNQELLGNLAFTARLNTAAVSGSNPLKINVNASVAVEYSDVISNQSTVLLVFDLQGSLVKKCVYSLSAHASLNLPPSCESYQMVLPVGLSFFEATPQNRQVEIKWSTASELNNDFFTVQRSKDGMHYEEVAIVKGGGTQYNPQHYAVVDTQPFEGLSYYRLKQNDYDGRFAYSSVSLVSRDDLFEGMSIYPNPGKGNTVFLKFPGNMGGNNIQVTIYNSQGQRIAESVSVTETGSGLFALRFSSILAPGVYQLLFSGEQQLYRGKFLVQ